MRNVGGDDTCTACRRIGGELDGMGQATGIEGCSIVLLVLWPQPQAPTLHLCDVVAYPAYRS